MKVLSTYRTLLAKAFNEDINESWVDWAIGMIEAGYESEHLYILAGQNKPNNQFKLQDLASRVLQELELDHDNKATVINNYVSYLISKSVGHPETYHRTLDELNDIYYGLDMDSQYKDFHLLYFAKDALITDEVQWYWDDANRENIDKIIDEKFHKWLNDFSPASAQA